jgi:hypothetical protein
MVERRHAQEVWAVDEDLGDLVEVDAVEFDVGARRTLVGVEARLLADPAGELECGDVAAKLEKARKVFGLVL